MASDILIQLNELYGYKIEEDGTVIGVVSDFIINKTLNLLENIELPFGIIIPKEPYYIVIEWHIANKEICLIIKKENVSLHYQIDDNYGIIHYIKSNDIGNWINWFQKE